MESTGNKRLIKKSHEKIHQKAKELITKPGETEVIKDRKIYPKPSPKREFIVKTHLPIIVSPEIKNELKNKIKIEKKRDFNVIIDLTDPKSLQGKIRIRKARPREKKRVLDILIPATPSIISTEARKFEGPLDKDFLREIIQRKRNKLENNKSIKRQGKNAKQSRSKQPK